MIPLTSSKIGSKFQKTDKFVKSAVWSVNHYFFVENSLAVEFRGTWRGLMSLNSATPSFRQSGISLYSVKKLNALKFQILPQNSSQNTINFYDLDPPNLLTALSEAIS